MLSDGKNKNISPVYIVTTFVLFAIAMIFVTIYITSYSKNFSSYFTNNNVILEEIQLLLIYIILMNLPRLNLRCMEI